MPPPSLQEPPVRPSVVEMPDIGGPPPPDRWQRRLFWGLLASVIVNALLWPLAARVIRSHLIAPPVPITFKRILLPPPPKKIVRHRPKPKPPVIKPKPIVHHAPPVHRKPIVRRPVPVRRPPIIPPRPAPHPPPPAAHQHILTAKGPAPPSHTALPGGHAPVGVPTEHQNPREGRNVKQPPLPQPAPPPQPPVRQPEPVHQAPPPPQPAPPPPPKPQPPPAPAGPTRDAQPANQTMPEIPDELKSGDYKSHVRVKVEIGADGSFSASLLTSSGNEEIDRRVLDALKRWKWKPALQNGQPVVSTARFRFDFEVQ